MLSSKTIILTALICSLFLICFIAKNSANETVFPQLHAPFKIEALESEYGTTEEYNYGSHTYHFSIRMNRPYRLIAWYVDNEYIVNYKNKLTFFLNLI